MTNVLIAGERSDLIAEAFRGMQARRDADGWISVTGRLERVPGEALMRALQRVETELPRRIGSTRDEHRAAALDEIARQLNRPRSRRRPRVPRRTENVKDFAVLHTSMTGSGEQHAGLVFTHPRRFPRHARNHAAVLAGALARFVDAEAATFVRPNRSCGGSRPHASRRA